MKDFFKTMFASAIGFIIALILFTIVIFSVISGVVSSFDESVIIPEKSILTISLNDELLERTSNNPFANVDVANLSNSKNLGLNEILKSIKFARTDNKISGILLDVSTIPAGYASIEAIGAALDTFRSSGKFVYAYGENISQKAYFLSTHADKIFMNPLGTLEFKGLYMELMFYKNALQKLDVEPQIIRHGKFKSAIEPYILDKMSDANKIQLNTYVDGIWNHILEQVSKSRNIDIAKLNDIANNLETFRAANAMSNKMLDGLIYRDELETKLKEKAGLKADAKTEYITINKYYESVKSQLIKFEDEKIAVIFASGEIVNDNASDEIIDGKRMASTIRKAKNDSTIKAIVLRVNSPGGDAIASEMIWREVFLANKVKPVIVSMGDYAASGGYYISCAARKIFAEPTTLTGSIGVFGMIPNMQKLFENKLGLTFDTVKTNSHSDYISTFHALSDFDKNILQNQIEDIYSVFTKRVADGRKMKQAEVDSIGQGRIWSGIDAKKIGLIDEFGGIYEAIAFAAKEAKLSKYSIVELPTQRNIISELLNNSAKEVSIKEQIRESLGNFSSIYDAYSQMKNVKGIQTRLPFIINMY